LKVILLLPKTYVTLSNSLKSNNNSTSLISSHHYYSKVCTGALTECTCYMGILCGYSYARRTSSGIYESWKNTIYSGMGCCWRCPNLNPVETRVNRNLKKNVCTNKTYGTEENLTNAVRRYLGCMCTSIRYLDAFNKHNSMNTVFQLGFQSD
jgi:hypothetical protein